jgi:hypothetical protein
MKLVATLYIVAALCFPANAEESATTTALCGMAAMKDYLAARVALSQQESSSAVPFPTIETIIARRRLTESFCLKFTRCTYPDGSTPVDEVEASIAFQKCLQDEAVEAHRE